MDLCCRGLSTMLLAPCLNRFLDFSPTLRKQRQDRLRDSDNFKALDLAPLVLRLDRLITAARNFPPQGRLVDFTGVTNRFDHIMGFQRVTFPSLVESHIYDRTMCVQLRIQRTRSVVFEDSGTKIRRRYPVLG